MTGIMLQRNIKRARLPRKRKKKAIKAQGRAWYNATITLFYITGDEPICKFWVNDSVSNKVVVNGGKVNVLPTPTKYW